MKNLIYYIKHLYSRNLIKTTTISEDLLNTKNLENEIKENLSIYAGFDPTAERIHFGNYLQLISLTRAGLYDLKPIILIGGGTGSIGDPSGKNKEREKLSSNKIKSNSNKMTQKLETLIENTKKFILNKKGKEINFEFVNNKDFYDKMNILEFFTDYGFCFNLSTLISRDTVKKRLDENLNISYTEFSYQILQAIDFYILRKKKNCILQIGGSDQWGNILTGIQLCQKMGLKNVHGLTTDLLLDENGNKFGKSENTQIWIDNDSQSLLNIFQYLFNLNDSILKDIFYKFTFLNDDQIEAILTIHEQNVSLRYGQEQLALEILEQISGCKNLALKVVNYQKYFKIDFEKFVI